MSHGFLGKLTQRNLTVGRRMHSQPGWAGLTILLLLMLSGGPAIGEGSELKSRVAETDGSLKEARPDEASDHAGFEESSADLIFQHLNEDNGLASPVVSAFAEDGDGFFWVGGQNGLQRWDGYSFRTYKTRLGAADSLPDNWVQALYTDWQGRLWIGTSSGGLARYDRVNDRFVRYRADGTSSAPASVAGIAGDGGRGLWIGTPKGLVHLDTDTGKFTEKRLVATAATLPDSKSVAALARSADGTLWIGTEAGLQRSVAGGEFERILLPTKANAQPSVTKLFLDHTGRIWIATQHGLYEVDATSARNPPSQANGEARAVTAIGTGSGVLASGRFLSVVETSAGEIWAGTQENGILAIVPAAITPGDARGGKAWKIRQISHNAILQTSLADDWIPELFLGRSGIVWAATHRGISYIDTSQKGIFTVLQGTGSGKSAGNGDVYSVLARRDGSLWLGLTKHGIVILDPSGHRTGAVVPLGTAQSAKDDSLPTGTVNGLAEADDGSVYICTQQGLYKTQPPPKRAKAELYDAETERIAKVPIGAAASSGLVQVFPDEGKLWLGGNSGFWAYDPANKTMPAQRPAMQRRLTDDRVTVIARGPAGTLWIGTQNGLNRYDPKTGWLETILPDSVDPAALGAGFISTVMTDRQGRLWVGTFGGGIDVLDHRDASGRASFHRIVDGLPNENVDMLLQAADGTVWASTDGGLATIDPVTFEIHVMGRAEGVDIPAYWNSDGATTAAGDLVFGGIGGISVVRPGMVKPWNYQPPVVVTSARIGSFDVPPSRFNSGTDIYPVWIPANENNLTVEFAALDYTAPERNRYEYKMEGFDQDWIAADSTQRVARYTNLPPDTYTLLLRGSNRQGVWSPIRRVRILVLPAWYQKMWFRVLMVLLGLLALGGLFLLATAYLRRQQRELERQVAIRTAELRQMTVELQASQQQLEQMAYTDSLTGLPNRRMFTEHFKRLLALKRRQDGSFAVLLMDFDAFKSINDTYGHDAGDAVLKEMARRMMALVRESDCLARLGGDEFGLLLAGSSDVEGTELVCHKIVESFVTPIVFEGVELRTAPSIGIAMYPADGEAQDPLYKAADLALYEAKRKGGNRCSWRDRSSFATGLQ